MSPRGRYKSGASIAFPHKQPVPHDPHLGRHRERVWAQAAFAVTAVPWCELVLCATPCAAQDLAQLCQELTLLLLSRLPGIASAHPHANLVGEQGHHAHTAMMTTAWKSQSSGIRTECHGPKGHGWGSQHCKHPSWQTQRRAAGQKGLGRAKNCSFGEPFASKHFTDQLKDVESKTMRRPTQDNCRLASCSETCQGMHLVASATPLAAMSHGRLAATLALQLRPPPPPWRMAAPLEGGKRSNTVSTFWYLKVSL